MFELISYLSSLFNNNMPNLVGIPGSHDDSICSIGSIRIFGTLPLSNLRYSDALIAELHVSQLIRR